MTGRALLVTLFGQVSLKLVPKVRQPKGPPLLATANVSYFGALFRYSLPLVLVIVTTTFWSRCQGGDDLKLKEN